jgi:radical SAM-linked protein
MRVRFRFSKVGKVRFTSHRDVARMWERAIRRAGLPVSYSAGFAPRPRMSFGLALPTGCSSLAEYVDVELGGQDASDRPPTGLDPADLPGALTPVLPVGVTVEEAGPVATGTESLQEAVTCCGWALAIEGGDVADLTRRVALLLASEVLPVVRERKGREVLDDLRPSVRRLRVEPDPVSWARGPVVVLDAELATQPRGVRPTELVRALEHVGAPGGVNRRPSRRVDGTVVAGGGSEGTLALSHACRIEQWIEHDGDRRAPLEPEGAPSGRCSARRALERAGCT